MKVISFLIYNVKYSYQFQWSLKVWSKWVTNSIVVRNSINKYSDSESETNY